MIQVVTQLDPALDQQVMAYLAERAAHDPAVCGEHDPRWLAILRDALGHDPYRLIARSGASDPSPQGEVRRGAAADVSDEPAPLPASPKGEGVKQADTRIVGYLPLALVATRLFGRFLVSLPYLNRAGVVANDAAIAAALVERAVALADELDVRYLELRHGAPLPHADLPVQRDEKVRMVLTLPADSDALWSGLTAKVRNQVRKGDKSDLTLAWGGRELLDDFYDVFAVNMRDLGTPVYPRKLFAAILEQFAGDAELTVVRHEGKAIGGALLWHDTLVQPRLTQVPSASTLRQFNATNANMWMYHHLLLRALARGSRGFDFGRSSTDSGTYRFKKQWGAQPVGTVWQYHLRQGDMNVMRPDNPRNRRRIAVWQRLPVWLTRLVGPHIVRGIP